MGFLAFKTSVTANTKKKAFKKTNTKGNQHSNKQIHEHMGERRDET